MRLRKIGDLCISIYGVTTAVDKLCNFVKDERDYAETKAHKKMMKKHPLYTDFDKIEYPTKDAALDVLDRLRDVIDVQGYASVSDLYEITGMVPTAFDTKIGWRVLYDNEVKVKRFGAGYKLVLPRPKYISR